MSEKYTINPFADTSTQVNLLDIGTLEEQAQALAEHTKLDAAYHAILLGCLRMEQQADGQKLMQRVMAAVQRCGRAIAQAVTEHRTVYEPLREGSLLATILAQLNIQVEEIEHLSTQRQHDTYEAAANPWTLRREGEQVLAENALLAMLEWNEACRSEARAVLTHWA